MNPSDNVMRAGLTAKHIDTEELIKVLGESQDAPVIQRPTPRERARGHLRHVGRAHERDPHPR